MARKNIPIKEVLPKLTTLTTLLTDDENRTLSQNLSVQLYKKNEIIYREGDTPSSLLCLVMGKVKIHKSGVGGRTQIVRVISSVDYFGYRAAFAGENYVTAAAAIEPSVIVKVPISIVNQLLSQNASLAMYFIQHLAKSLGRADERTVNLTQKHIRGRLAESLLFLKERYGVEEDGATLSIYLSREDLANLSNMTTSNAIRTLSNFATEKIIAIDGRKIKLIDESKLEKISRIG